MAFDEEPYAQHAKLVIERCVFCGIIQDQERAAVVHANEDFLVILDHRPVFPGHCLIIPKEHAPDLSALSDERFGPLFLLARRTAAALESALDSQGAFIAVNDKISQSVPHVHVHVVPRRAKDGLRGFFWPRQKYASTQDMQRVAEMIRVAFEI